MKNSSKNGETLTQVEKATPCQASIAGVTTVEQKITDKKRLNKLIAYLIMGDGGVYIRNKNAQFIMNTTNMEYAEYAKGILSHITSVAAYSRKDYNTDGCNRLPQVRLETRVHPLFTKMRNQIYTENYKGLSSHYLKMLDGESLAILYMSDGGFDLKGKAISSVNLHLKRLTEGDILLFRKYLKDKLGIDSSTNKHYHRFFIRIKSKDIGKFFSLINPYILPSFRYKVPDEELLKKYQDDDTVCASMKVEEVSGNDLPPING